MKTKPARTVALAYQAGIANVFAVSHAVNQPPVRLLQADFRSCEMFARGMGAAGEKVRSFASNVAGDCVGTVWSQDLESAPFSDKFHPVTCN